MNKLHLHLVTAGLLATFGLAAVAQTQAPPAPPAGGPYSGQGPRMMQGPMDPARMQRFRAERREQRMAARLGELKQILQITPQQEGAWSTWTSNLRPPQFQRPSRVEFARMTTPERIDRIRALRAQRNAEMDKRLEATKTFYGTLTAEQKRLFDAEGNRFMRGGRGAGMRGGRGGHFGGGFRQG